MARMRDLEIFLKLVTLLEVASSAQSVVPAVADQSAWAAYAAGPSVAVPSIFQSGSAPPHSPLAGAADSSKASAAIS
ncbi:unnamed protein product [Cunninghamella echinulata]